MNTDAKGVRVEITCMQDDAVTLDFATWMLLIPMDDPEGQYVGKGVRLTVAPEVETVTLPAYETTVSGKDDTE